MTLFRSGDDWWHNAVLPGGRTSWVLHVEGYRIAAEALVERACADRTQLNFLIYPIVQTYRHFLEIALKSLIRDLDLLLENGRTMLMSHDLRRLLARFRSTYGEFIVPLDREIPDLTRLEGAVSAFNDADPRAVAFRYPLDTDGNRHEYPYHINIRVLRDDMGEVAFLLDAFDCELSVYLDFQNEMRGLHY